MKNKKRMYGRGIAAAIVLALVFVVITGCSEDDGGISLPGNKKASDLPAFDGAAITENEASALLSSLYSSDLLKNIGDADYAVSKAAFNDKYSMSATAYLTSKATEKSVSADYSVNDSEELKKYNFKSGTTKGSSKMTISSNLTLSEVYLSVLADLEESFNVSDSDSLKRDIEFTGYVDETAATYGNDGKKYEATGFLHIESSGSSKTTYKKEGKRDSSSKENNKAALAVSFSVETTKANVSPPEVITKKGAKILISYSNESSGSSNERSIQNGSSRNAIASIEFYDNNNQLICKEDTTSHSVLTELRLSNYTF